MAPLSRVLASPPGRVIVRGVNWLGDAVMTTPALQRLRETFPSAHVTLLTPAKLAELWCHHPAIDAVWAMAGATSVARVAARVRAGRFDLGLVLPNSPRSALELWLGGVPCRVGYAARWRRWWLTHALPPRAGHVGMRKRPAGEVRRLVGVDAVSGGAPGLGGAVVGTPTAHHLHHYLGLVAALGARAEPVAPRLQVTTAEVESVRAKFGLGAAGSPGRWWGLNAGAEYGPAKRWPAEQFVAVAREVQRRSGVRWVVLGGARDVGLAGQIASEIGREVSGALPCNLAGRTSLRELCAVLRACEGVLTNDTGPMHVAAAVGTAVVALFGSTSPGLTGPGLPGTETHACLVGRAPCAPCFRRTCPVDLRCLGSIRVDEVVTAVLARTALSAVG